MIKGKNTAPQTTKNPAGVSNWPMKLEGTRQALHKTNQRLNRYQTALRLANREIERRNHGMMTLTNFIHQANQSLAPANLLQLALRQALQMTGAPVGAIVLIDTETKSLTLAIHKGLTTELSDILVGQQLGLGATVLMPHLVTGSGALLERTTDDEAEQLLLTIGGLSSLVSLPIRLEARLLGTLLVGFRQDGRSFNSAELHFLMILCQETATALDNLNLRDDLWQTAEQLLSEGVVGIRLSDRAEITSASDIPAPLEISRGTPMLESVEDDMEHLLAAMMEAEDEVQQQNIDLQTLNTVSEIINRTFNLVEILQRAVEHTQSTLQTDAAWICLQDNHGLLQIQAHVGFHMDDVQGIPHLKLEESIEGQVVIANKPCFIEFLPSDARKHKTWLNTEQLQAVAIVPISRPVKHSSENPTEGVVGVLAAAKHISHPYTWTPREIRLLTAIANQLAVAIENAQLYDQVYEREVGLRWSNQLLRDINDMLLEKNAYLEGFVQDDLPQAFTEISQILQYIQGGMVDEQQKKVNQLQTIVQRLGELSKEAGYMSSVLDTALDETIEDEVKQNNYSGTTKPVRLKKSGTAELKAKPPEPDKPNPPTPPYVTNAKPMSFEDAVAAGLVPVHIMSKEQNS
jgi:GAF domain-containing protein